MDGRIFKIKELLSQNLTKHWSVDELAATVRMSPPGFRRLFRHELHSSPSKYLHDLRICRAQEFLTDPDCFLRIKEIGVLVGLTSDSHFTRDFKELTGLSPVEFRRKCAQRYQATVGIGKK